MRTRLKQSLATLASLSLIPLATVSAFEAGAAAAPAAIPGSTNATAEPATVLSKKGNGKYRARIETTKHGIPHITAKGFGGLGYGSGYAAAESSVCTLFDTLVTGRGQRSLFFGPDARYDDQVTLEASNLQVDAFVTDLHNRRVVEKLFAGPAGPEREAKQIVKGYAAGVNRFIRETGRRGVTDAECKGAQYLKPNVKAVDLWYGVYLANLLASAGVFVKEVVDAAPPTPGDPGLPDLPLRASQVDRDALLAGLGKDPAAAFGSNATAVGGEDTSTGKGMLLGNPHFPWRGRYHFTQQQLTIPGKYDVAGASLIGSPVVNIGWNKDVAWSHTVSTAYRFTPYEYKTPVSGTTYLTDSGPRELERRLVKVRVRRANGSVGTVTEDLYRTPQGYVLDAPALFMPWSPTSFWAFRDANAEHLRTIDTFLQMGKATNVRDLLRRQDKGGGMPWVNTTAADRSGNVLYADHSVVPNVPTALAQRCMTPVGRVLDEVAGLPGLDGTFADSSCAWGTDADAQRPGMFGPANLPAVVRRDWVHNANDSYWLPNPDVRLEGFANIIGCEKCERTMRTRMVAQYVIDRLASGRKETPASFRRHEHANRLRGAEVMRAGGALDQVCAATGETKACAVLKAWDGRSQRSSVGTHIFEEFANRTPDQGLWRTPFSAADPLNTPRDLNAANPQVVAAMQGAIDSLRARKIPFDATWGSLQVAGDRGAPAIGLGGGDGGLIGNANVLSSRNPERNSGRYKPITYGSSHIQAIAFQKKGKVNARTILTYSQQEDPKARYSADQTRIFAKKQWVKFAWTRSQIKKDLVDKVILQGR
ncbi:penicillin acylase family protein [Nocardioides salsibiostraticola]